MTNSGICIKCKNIRKIFYNKMCQTCYRKEISIKKNNTKYKSIYNGNSEKIKTILNLIIENKYSKKEISKIVGYNYKSLYAVCKKYLIEE